MFFTFKNFNLVPRFQKKKVTIFILHHSETYVALQFSSENK